MIKNYNQVIELDAVTLEDCLELYMYKDMITIIEDGRITNFREEKK